MHADNHMSLLIVGTSTQAHTHSQVHSYMAQGTFTHDQTCFMAAFIIYQSNLAGAPKMNLPLWTAFRIDTSWILCITVLL